MAKQKEGPSKSDYIRELLRTNPRMRAKDVVSTLADQGISVSTNLVHFVKGKLKGQRGRRKKTGRMVAKVAATGNGDPVATILKIKSFADQVGGLKKLKALVDALSG